MSNLVNLSDNHVSICYQDVAWPVFTADIKQSVPDKDHSTEIGRKERHKHRMCAGNALYRMLSVERHFCCPVPAFLSLGIGIELKSKNQK